VDEQPKEYKFTEEQLKFIKKFRLIMVPFRLILAATFFSMITGGFRRFFSETPGQLFIGLFACMVITERIFQAPDAGGKRKDQGSAAVLWVAFGVAYVVGMVDHYWIRPHWHILEWHWYWAVAGAGFYLIGQFIRVMAIRTLGRFFTISVRLHEEHKVIQEGPYRYIRHPAYTGLYIINLGFVTLFGSVFAFGVFFLFGLPGLLYRIKVEEQMLTEQFGEEYLEYMRKTKRLVPFVF
jgi:protein-S-isoprenylcysteine O-methyltransferase Ste14